MKSLNALVALAFASAVVATPAPIEERQLGDLPSIVCLTGVLSSVGASILEGLGITILDCDAGETCTALDIPIVGDLLPIGVSRAYYTLVLD